MPDPSETICWDGTRAGDCPTKDSREVIDLGNGHTFTTGSATWCANVTCPTCRAGEDFAIWNTKQDLYWAGEEAEADAYLAEQDTSAWVKEGTGGTWFAQRTDEAQQADTWVYPRDAVRTDDGKVLWLQPDTGATSAGQPG